MCIYNPAPPRAGAIAGEGGGPAPPHLPRAAPAPGTDPPIAMAGHASEPIESHVMVEKPEEMAGWLQLATAIMQVVKEHDENHVDILGCTNYQDLRLLYLIAGIARKAKMFTLPQMVLLGGALTRFLADLDAEGRYTIPRSGSYWLKVKRRGLEALAASLLRGEMTAEVMMGLEDAPPPASVLAAETRWKAMRTTAESLQRSKGEPTRLTFVCGWLAAAGYCVGDANRLGFAQGLAAVGLLAAGVAASRFFRAYAKA